MKPIEKESLRKLLTIIPDHPQTRLLHFADSGTELPLVLQDFAHQKDYEYRLNCTTQEYAKRLASVLPADSQTHVRFFSLTRPRYMQQGKLYDFVFVTAQIPNDEKEAFLQKVHPIIKNGGNIFFFLEKGDHAVRFEWMRLLEEHYYVASSAIDDLFVHYDLIISKKMHGWGG